MMGRVRGGTQLNDRLSQFRDSASHDGLTVDRTGARLTGCVQLHQFGNVIWEKTIFFIEAKLQ